MNQLLGAWAEDGQHMHMQTAAADLWHEPACTHPWLSTPPTPFMLVALPCAAGRLTSWSTSTLSRCASACTASLTDQLPHEPPSLSWQLHNQYCGNH